MGKVREGKWSVEQMSEFLQTSDKVLYGALLALYNCQTEDEKSAGDTHIVNHMGFNGVDAPFLSSVAQSLKKYGRLTDKQKEFTRKKIVKYVKQITTLANIDWDRKHIVD